jgi:hypothetical protein
LQLYGPIIFLPSIASTNARYRLDRGCRSCLTLQKSVHRGFGLGHLPENKPGFGDRSNVIGIEFSDCRKQTAELTIAINQRDQLSSALICAGHSLASHGSGPGCGCWRPMVLGSIRLWGDSLSRVASVACILVAFSQSTILSGSCAAAREINVD